MKRKPMIMKLATLMCAMALMLSMTSVTVFAAKNDDSITGSDSVTTSTDDNKTSATDSPAATNDIDSRYNIGLGTSESTDDSAKATDENSTASNTAIDSTETLTSEPSATDNSANMSATKSNDDTETVKTGEFDMIPIIGALAAIAIVAGSVYVIYSKKKN